MDLVEDRFTAPFATLQSDVWRRLHSAAVWRVMAPTSSLKSYFYIFILSFLFHLLSVCVVLSWTLFLKSINHHYFVLHDMWQMLEKAYDDENDIRCFPNAFENILLLFVVFCIKIHLTHFRLVFTWYYKLENSWKYWLCFVLKESLHSTVMYFICTWRIA